MTRRADARAFQRFGALALIAVQAAGARASGAPDPEVEALIRGRVEVLRSGTPLRAAGAPVLARLALPVFYEERGFVPAWIRPGNESRLDDLQRAIQRAARHGLDPRDYHADPIARLRALEAGGGASLADRVDLELLATDAFLVLGSHLLHGRVNPETIEPEWLANRRRAAMHEVLASALERNRVESALYDLAPAQPRYALLLKAADRLRDIAARGGWPMVHKGRRLEPGVEGADVVALRGRLRASGDLSDPAGSDVFDDSLAAAVRRFQRRHGLEPDGVVGPATVAALNTSAADRVLQVEINLERWRWLPQDLGERHVEVNIAGFEVRVVDGGRTVRRHRAVVGREYRQTPMFSGRMTYLVLSPFWHVPPTIAAVDKLPAIRQDPSAIAAQRMVLLDQTTQQPVDVSTVDWAGLTGPEFNRRYRLRQDPGPANALGRVKFMFPNRHNVYLHDTPSRELFDRASRGFSSGCIRVEDPLDLAAFLLADQPEWSRRRIDEVVALGQERTVTLTRPVPVHLLYWTAWADFDGTLHFRTDVYGRDGTVRRGLDSSPPGA